MNREQELEKELKSTLRVLIISTKEALDSHDRLVKNGHCVFNQGQFLRLIDNRIDEIAKLLGERVEETEYIPWRKKSNKK